ncbi:MAG: hypothetical protein JNJ73_10245 [Hyphomonadaceae bacterium]|nr:hypothetical protein [Hyphomonadaceae bacterium]
MFWFFAFASIILVSAISFAAGMWVGRAGLTDEEIRAAREARLALKAGGVFPHAQD